MNKNDKGFLVNSKSIAFDLFANIFVFILCNLYSYYILLQTNDEIFNRAFITWVYILIYLLVGMSNHHYDLSAFFYRDRLLKRVTSGCFLATLLIVSSYYYFEHAFTDIEYYMVYFLLCYLFHLIAAFISYYQNREQNGAKNSLFIGSRENYEWFVKNINKTSFSFNPIGYLSIDPEPSDSKNGCLGCANIENLIKLVHEMVVDQVYIIKDLDNEGLIQNCVDLCVKFGVVAHYILPYVREDCSVRVSSLGNSPVLSYHLNNLNPGLALIKRIIDIIGSAVGLVISAPLILIAAIVIKIDSPGPVFFAQRRVGRNGKRFKMYKLRTMVPNAEAMKKDVLSMNELEGDGVIFKMKNDPRITKVGSFLRRNSIDELPQFFNVFRGDMSLVGTRPPTEDEVNKYESEHWRRLRVMPGITGLWQISGRSSIKDFNEIVELDTQYIKNWSILNDLKIILTTVIIVFKNKDAF